MQARITSNLTIYNHRTHDGRTAMDFFIHIWNGDEIVQCMRTDLDGKIPDLVMPRCREKLADSARMLRAFGIEVEVEDIQISNLRKEAA